MSSPDVNTDATGLVIRGYDPVAYFTAGRPVPGRSDLWVEYYPEKYLPQYGGYCAFGVAMGKKFDIDPGSWRIVDGRLYFNLNPTILEKWSADTKGYIPKSEKYWPKIRDKAASEL
jgi:hypothetical protein